jgi:hypothetical protein
MSDPLSQLITLLQPRAVFSKRISGAGRWAVRYTAFGQPSFCAVLEGSCRLAVDGEAPITLQAGDFVLMPTTPGFTQSGFHPCRPIPMDPKLTASGAGEVRHGTRGGRPDVRLLGGYFAFGSLDAGLLVPLLPTLIHVRGIERLATLVGLVGEESLAQRPGRELVLTRLVEVLLIEALRAVPAADTRPGLLRGLQDAQLGAALRQMHRHVARPWTVVLLVLRALHAYGRHHTHGVLARLAHGRGPRPVAPRGSEHHRGRRACRLRVGQHLQHGLPSPRRNAPPTLRTRRLSLARGPRWGARMDSCGPAF